MNDYSNLLGKQVNITIDRPLGSYHPRHPNIYYPINYGYVEGILGGDGAEQDVYLMGIDVPVSSYQAVIIAVIHRYDDVETKWVAAPFGVSFSKEEIQQCTFFQEQFFHTEIFC